MEKEIQKSMSCRRVSVRHLPIIVSDGTVNGRESGGRPRTETLRGDKHFYNGNNGFTLIELLVVVLIIGILAAVAVPQYQFAVDKSRAMTHFQNAQAIVKAQQVYKMANGNYTGDFTALDVDFTKTCSILAGSCHNELRDCPGKYAFQIYEVNCVPTTDNLLVLRECKTTPCYSSTSQSSNLHFLMHISLINGSIKECFHYTNRGKKLCNYFTQQFGTSN